MAIAGTTDFASSVPSNLKTTTQAKREAEEAVLNGDGGAMGQTAFLTLFTAQLKSQNPLDPMDNTAFVSQLAQFSQLEATTKMAASLDNMSSGSSADRMMAAASLIGKKVSVNGGQAILTNGEPVKGTVALANDIESMTINVFSSSGALIRTGQIGAQKAGNFDFTWDGMDSNGTAVADGKYRIEATVSRFGAQKTAPVSTLAVVNSVSSDTATGDLKLDLGAKTTMSLSEVQRVGL